MVGGLMLTISVLPQNFISRKWGFFSSKFCIFGWKISNRKDFPIISPQPKIWRRNPRCRWLVLTYNAAVVNWPHAAFCVVWKCINRHVLRHMQPSIPQWMKWGWLGRASSVAFTWLPPFCRICTYKWHSWTYSPSGGWNCPEEILSEKIVCWV